MRSLDLNMSIQEVFQFFILADRDNDYRIMWREVGELGHSAGTGRRRTDHREADQPIRAGHRRQHICSRLSTVEGGASRFWPHVSCMSVRA